MLVPGDKESIDDILGLFNGIGKYKFDPLEPFVAYKEDKSVTAQVGGSQMLKSIKTYHCQ